MKRCPRCSAKNQDGAKFCMSCGTDLTNVQCESDVPQEENVEFLQRSSAFLEKRERNAQKKAERDQEKRQSKAAQSGIGLIDPDETVQAVIGNSFPQNFFFGGGAKKNSAALTEKRVYFAGSRVSLQQIRTGREESIISVEDVTMTGFVHYQSVGFLIAAVIFLIMAIGCIVVKSDSFQGLCYMSLVGTVLMFLLYILSRVTNFVIYFPGGQYVFNTKMYPMEDVLNFQRQLHLMKDQVKESKRVRTEA